MTFSPQLVERFTKHFRAKYGLELTATQANEYLYSYSELFLVFAREMEMRAAARPQSAPDDRASSDLINSTLSENA
jgi:hypothetical protein